MSDEQSKTFGRPFTKGVSGNPAGRSKGLERLVRETVGDDMVAIVYVQRCVALGMPPDPERLAALGVALTKEQREAIAKTFAALKPRESTEAAKLVADRGWGKAPQTVSIKDGNAATDGDLDDMDDAELEREIARLEGNLSSGVH